MISFEGKEQDIFWDDDLGTIRLTLRLPFKQESFTRHTRYFELFLRTELLALGTFARHPPSTVFACRQAPGSVSCTTVSGTPIRSRMEFHPVLPVPTASPPTAIPVRPAALSGVPATNPINAPGSATPTAASAMNAFANPAVIPILGPPNAAPVGPQTNQQLDAANWVNPRNAARIEYTSYQPGTLAFADYDDRLTWNVVSVAGGGAVAFLKSDGTSAATDSGKKVMVYGTAAGEIRLVVQFNLHSAPLRHEHFELFCTR